MGKVNYTTFTEIDPNNRYAVTPNVITVTGIQFENAYIYKGFGVGRFGDLPLGINFETVLDSGGSIASLYSFALSNHIANVQPHFANSWEGIFVGQSMQSGRILFIQSYNTAASDIILIILGVRYYCTLTRLGITTILKVYTDAARTIPFDVLAINPGATAFQNLYPATAYDSGDTSAANGEIANHEILDSSAYYQQLILNNRRGRR